MTALAFADTWRGDLLATRDGSSIEVVTRPAELERMRTYTGDVGAALSALESPASAWRLFVVRSQVVRADRPRGVVVRDRRGLLDTPATRGPADILRRWAELAEVEAWAERYGARKGMGSAASLGVALLGRPEFAPPFTPLRGCLVDELKMDPWLLPARTEILMDRLGDGGTYRGPCGLLDANGAYLDILRTVELPYPYRPTPGVALHLPGLTRARVREEYDWPLLPRADGTYRRGWRTGFYTNRELAVAASLGADIHPLEGMHFPASTRALQPLATFLAEQREQAESPVVRQLCKRIPNALIGRFAHLPSYCMTRPAAEAAELRTRAGMLGGVYVGDAFVGVYRLRRRSPWFARAWHIHILAEQRIRLRMKAAELEAAGHTVLYLDTDGLIFGAGGTMPPTSARIGGWKLEWTAPGVRIRGLRNYTARATDGRVKMKASGKHGEAARVTAALADLAALE